MGNSSNLAGAWSSFWGAISGSAGINNLTTILAIVGMLLIVGALVKFVWDKRRGGGGNSQAVIWTMIVGGILAGPNVFIPLLLTLADFIVNLFETILRSVT